MTNIATTYSQLLKSASNLRNRSFGISTSLKIFLNSLEASGFLPFDFLDQIDNYPKYPYFFPVIDDLKKYNLLKIYNITSDDTNYLLDAISDSYVRGLKKKYDKIPERDIVLDVCLQNSVLSTSDNLMKNSFFNNSFKDTKIDNYVFDLFDGELDVGISDSSVIFLTLLKMILKKNLPTMITAYQKTIEYVTSENTLTMDLLKDEFSNYIADKQTTFTKEIVRFIFRYCYGLSYFSDSFLDGVCNSISSDVLNITTSFNSFVDLKKITSDEVVSATIDTLFGYVSTDVIKQIYSDSLLLVDDTAISSLRDNLEQPRFDELFSKNNEPMAKQYLFLTYFYKFWPKRFLNIIQMIYYEYVNNYLKSSDIKAFSSIEVTSQFQSMINIIDWSRLSTLLNSLISNSYLSTINNTKFISSYSAQYWLSNILDEFLDPEQCSYFDDYLNTLFESVFNYLKTTGQISHTFDYYNNRDIVIVYIKTFLREGLFGYGLIEEILTSTSKYLVTTNSDCYSVSGVWLESDTTYTGINYYIGGSVSLDQITLSTSLPSDNTRVRVKYKVKSLFVNYLEQLKTQTSYALLNSTTIDITESKLQSQTSQFLDIENSNMIQFIENLYSSSLSKKLILDNLSFFAV